MNELTDLYLAAKAADANVVGVALLREGVEPESHWHVYERADGARVRVDTADGAPPTEAAVAAVRGLDLSAEAEAARRAAESRTQAAGVLTGQREPDLLSLALLVRMLASDLYTRHNDLRQLHGLHRVLEPEIMAGLIAGLGG